MAKRRLPYPNAAQSLQYKLKNPFVLWENFKNNKNRNLKRELWEIHFFTQIYNIAITRYKWTGFPNDVDYLFAEDLMIKNGKFVFIRDNTIVNSMNKGLTSGFAIMKPEISGSYNIYDLPNEYFAYSNNGYHKKYDPSDSVIVYDKPLASPTIFDIRLYAQTLANTAMTRDMNKYMQRTPVALVGSVDDMVQWENLAKDYDEFLPFLKVGNSFNGNNFSALKTDVPFIGDKLSATLRQEKAEILGALGIECIMLEKSERLTSRESGAQDGLIESVRNVTSATRQRGADRINELFGKQIKKCEGGGEVKVEFNSALPTAVNGFLADVGMQFGGMRESTENINVNRSVVDDSKD